MDILTVVIGVSQLLKKKSLRLLHPYHEEFRQHKSNIQEFGIWRTHPTWNIPNVARGGVFEAFTQLWRHGGHDIDTRYERPVDDLLTYSFVLSVSPITIGKLS